MRIGDYTNGAVRQFAMNFANGRLGNHLLNGIDYISEAMKEEPSWVEQAFAVFLNNIEIDIEGNILNYSYSENRAAQYIRGYFDSSYIVESPFEPWEMELKPVSKDAYNK